MRSLPAEERSTWLLVNMPYSTAATPQAMAMSTTVMDVPSTVDLAGQGDAPRRGRARMCGAS
jgi:hypothetical protein